MEKRESAGVVYFLNRRRGLRNLRLHLDNQGKVIVSAPYYVSFLKIENFVASHVEWITQHQKHFPKYTYETGDYIPFLGQKRSLEVIGYPFTDSNKQTKIMSQCVLIDNKIIVYAQNKDINLVQNEIRNLYIQTVFDVLSTRVEYWANAIGVKVPNYGVNRAKTKWGVCYPKQERIYLSYMCAVLPLDLIDMTVLHEVCHLKVNSHGQPFWSLMEMNMPELKERKSRLKEISKTGISLNCV